MKKGVLRNFAKFTGKHGRQSPSLLMLQAVGLTLLKKRPLHSEFREISKNTFFTKHLSTTAFISCKKTF